MIDNLTSEMNEPWTDRHGVTRPLTAADFMVVAPYNDQRRCIETALRANPATRGVEVGTVDKFRARRPPWCCSR